MNWIWPYYLMGKKYGILSFCNEKSRQTETSRMEDEVRQRERKVHLRYKFKIFLLKYNFHIIQERSTVFSSKSLGNCMQHFFVKTKIKEHLYNPRKFPYATFVRFYLYPRQSLSDLYNHILALPFLEIHVNRITLYTFFKI